MRGTQISLPSRTENNNCQISETNSRDFYIIYNVWFLPPNQDVEKGGKGEPYLGKKSIGIGLDTEQFQMTYLVAKVFKAAIISIN